MPKGVDLSNFYHLRTNFTIIGLTGRTGSGCSKIADHFEKGFVQNIFPTPNQFDLNLNSYKKYKIVYRYAALNFQPYIRINYKDVLSYFILKQKLSDLVKFLSTEKLHNTIKEYYPSAVSNCHAEIISILSLKATFETLNIKVNIIEDLRDAKNEFYKPKLSSLFFSKEFKDFSNSLHQFLCKEHKIKRNIILQLAANNLRKSGNVFNDEASFPENVFTAVRLINGIIKGIRITKPLEPVKIVIDSMRNPMEILFFKQRYSSFYLMAVNRDDNERKEKLAKKYSSEYELLAPFFENEYKGGKTGEFFRSYVRDCIEKSDIHLTHRSQEDALFENEKRENKKDNTSPYFSWEMQLLKYVSLIDQPGIITPSPEERCMQMAYTAKYNSGCISRQVGAAVTDQNYSIKSVGWNNTPQGQVPCSLRNVEVLLEDDNKKPIKKDPELACFTPYERNDKAFRKSLEENYAQQIKDNNANLKGRNVCMCFKTLKNSYSEGKNQVHTRSLHAEESAFLQITKYGGTGIKNGKLFTTASPCELCSKKAYQLGIRVIYYVDPYPGISQDQILNTGYNPPEVRLFNGAIGNAYHWLYEPLMSYKDEMSLILGHNIPDYASRLSNEIKVKEEKIIHQENIILQLEEEISRLKSSTLDEQDEIPFGPTDE